MNCMDITTLQDYLEENLPLAKQAIIKEHIVACASCKRELSQLRLLFWELDELKKDRLTMPPEMGKVREKALNQLFTGSQGKLDLAKILKLQQYNLSKAKMFINFIPGVKPLKHGLRKAPSAAFSLSGSVLKGSFKLLQARLST